MAKLTAVWDDCRRDGMHVISDCVDLGPPSAATLTDDCGILCVSGSSDDVLAALGRPQLSHTPPVIVLCFMNDVNAPIQQYAVSLRHLS